MVQVVTVSATYGAGGSVIGPHLAARLGLPFVDRLIIATDTPPSREAIEERLSHEEEQLQPAGGLLSHLAQVTGGLSMPVPGSVDLNPRRRIRDQAEASIGRVVEAGGGLILGRAAAIVLAGDPNTYHIHLDGPVERRIRRAMEIEGIDEATARARQAQTDRARARYVSRLYNRDPADPTLYHMFLDSTVLPLDSCVDVLAAAALAFFAAREA